MPILQFTMKQSWTSVVNFYKNNNYNQSIFLKHYLHFSDHFMSFFHKILTVCSTNKKGDIFGRSNADVAAFTLRPFLEGKHIQSSLVPLNSRTSKRS